MTAFAPTAAPLLARFPLPLVLRLAVRDLRAGLRGFGIFLACIALGVTAIVGVGSVSRAFTDGLARRGDIILGGDVAFSTIHRELSAAEAAWLKAHGDVSTVAILRAMARRPDGVAALIEIKSVPANYPVRGSVQLQPPQPLSAVLDLSTGLYGVAVDPALLVRLDLHLGDQLRIGDLSVEIRAVLESEPDRLATGIGFSPRVLMSTAAVRATGLIQPASLVRWINRVVLTGQAPGRPIDAAAVQRFVEATNATFPEAGWEVRTRDNASPSFTKNIERFTQFLTLVGLTALIIGGVGVANAVWLYVDRKRPVIATLKSLGATGHAVFWINLAQVLLVALLAIAIGLFFGALLPFLLDALFGGLIPLPLAPTVYPGELVVGIVYGLLTTLAFSVIPLGRAHDVTVSALFRDRVEPEAIWPRPIYSAILVISVLALVSGAILTASDRRLALIYIGSACAAFALLRAIAFIVMAVARRLPSSRSVQLRLAVGNIHRPGALTPSVILSLGLGLSLLVTLTVIDANIRAELTHTLPGRTPSFFFLDIQNSNAAAFDAFLKSHGGPGMTIERVAMMRGRITKLNGQDVADVKAADNVSWVLDGDRGITYSSQVPEGSKLVAGSWWAADYGGAPLVSLEKEIADGLKLSIGDTISVNVFGRTITARIANLRRVDWRSFGINFVLVFSPNTFAGAPHSFLATATFPDGGNSAQELQLLKQVAAAFPEISSVRVKEALDTISGVLRELALAIRAASAVALAASLLVLAGALAAGQRSRIYDAVILKTLGATRAHLLFAYLLEYAILGGVTALFAVLTGVTAAWFIVAEIMKLAFAPFWSATLMVAAGGLVVTVVLGLAGTFRILGLKPAPFLRAL
jgi:putative ABC transport system permease protein